MLRILSNPRFRRLGFFVLIALIAAGMASTLARYGGPMLRAATELSPWSLSLALTLSLVYRLVNASGWALILRALGERVMIVASARIWLASEACRWLPGSLWSFGSRALLGSRRGIGGPVIASSLVLELVVTVLAWGVIAASGFWSLRMPTLGSIPGPRAALVWTIGAIVLGLAGFGISRTRRVRSRLSGLFIRLSELRRRGINKSGLFKSFCFFLAMGLFNGIILVVIVRSTPEGSNCPFWSIIGANAVAWLAGFLAIFAPGGLVVRESCLASLFAPWMTPSNAIAIALAWRLIQIIAEIACSAVVAAIGLPDRLLIDPYLPGDKFVRSQDLPQQVPQTEALIAASPSFRT